MTRRLPRLVAVGLVLAYQLGAAADQASNATPTLPSGTPPTDALGWKILAAGLGGFLAWLLTKSIALLVLRRRLLTYTTVVLNAHLRQYADIQQWLKATQDKTIRAGHVITLAATYTIDELDDLTELRSDALRLFRTHEIARLTALIHRLKELEALLAGFCATLEEYKLNRKTLDAPNVNYLQRKLDRIFSYMRNLPPKLHCLDSLPLEYPGILGADSLVTPNSAQLPPPPPSVPI